MEGTVAGHGSAAESNHGSEIRPADEVMTHGDVDQKNIVIAPGGPVLCDWDLAMPMVPRRELAETMLRRDGRSAVR